MNKEDIIDICSKYRIRNYTIGYNIDGLYIDVYGNVNLSHLRLNSIPVRFGKVSGDFDCTGNLLTSLEHCPKEIGGYFDCSINILTSLKHCPISVGGDFYCGINMLINESYHHLFELGYDTDIIFSDQNLDLVSLRRQWVLKSIING